MTKSSQTGCLSKILVLSLVFVDQQNIFHKFGQTECRASHLAYSRPSYPARFIDLLFIIIYISSFISQFFLI